MRLQQYCRRDVEVERELYRCLPPLSADEQALWELDAKINARGFYVDLELAKAAQKIVREEQAAIDREMAEITGGAVTSVNQVAKLQALLRERGHNVTGLTKHSVSALLARPLEADVQRLLELRREGAQAAARKLDSLTAGIDDDQRLRGTLRFHGASTGRWSGARFQPQNLKKPQTKNLDARDRRHSRRRSATRPRVRSTAGDRRRRVAEHDPRRSRARVARRRFQRRSNPASLPGWPASSGSSTLTGNSTTPAIRRWNPIA